MQRAGSVRKGPGRHAAFLTFLSPVGRDSTIGENTLPGVSFRLLRDYAHVGLSARFERKNNCANITSVIFFMTIYLLLALFCSIFA